MTLILINPSLKCGGSERVVTQLASHWAEAGHEVTILTTDRGETPYFPLSSRVSRIGVLQGFSSSKITAPIRKISALWRLRQEVKKRRADAVLCFQEMNNLYVMMALTGIKVPKIVAVRNHPAYKTLSPFYSHLRKRLYPKAQKIVVQTGGIREWFIKEGFAEEKLQVIQNPLKLPNVKKEEISPKTILACGRLVQQKGFAELIDTFALLSPQFPLWKLRIIGDGPEKDKLQQLAEDKGVLDKVEFAGFLTEPIAFYHAGNIFAFSSHYEGFPNALCEAMACGMAAVSVDCPSGPSDLIEDGVNGFLVKAGDEETFKNRLRLLMSDEKLRLTLGVEAEKIKEKLAIDKIAQQWLSLKDQR